MKKTLTPNITRYDSKMTFRMNRRTFGALLVSILAGLLLGFLLSMLLSMIYAISLALMGALLLLLAQVAEKEGMPIIRWMYLRLAAPFIPVHRCLYEHTADRPYDRLTIQKERRIHEKKPRKK